MSNKCADKFIPTFLRVYFHSSDWRALCQEWQQGNQAEIIKGIINHGLAGFFYQQLRAHPEWGFPVELQNGLKAAAQVIALQNAVYEREGRKITTALEQHQIPYLILKGFSLVERLYEDSGIRPISDIDIYIQRSDYARVRKILVSAGYQARMTPDYRGSLAEFIRLSEAYSTEITYVKSLGKSNINVDLHWGMDGLWDGSPLKDLFSIEEFPWMQYQRRAQIGPWDFSALSWEMQFLHIASHFALHHQFQGVKWLLDICLMLKKMGAELNWDFIWQTAGTADNRKVIAIILRMVEDETGLQAKGVPPWQFFWNGKALPGEYSYYRRRLLSQSSKKGQYLAYIMLPLKMRDKCRVLGYYLFNPEAVLHWRNEEPRLAWRWWQPFYLLYRAGEEFINQRRSG